MNHLHTSKNYEDELENLRTRVLTMGARRISSAPSRARVQRRRHANG